MIRLSRLQQSLKNFKTCESSTDFTVDGYVDADEDVVTSKAHISWEILKSSLELLKRSLMKQNMITRMRKMM